MFQNIEESRTYLFNSIGSLYMGYEFLYISYFVVPYFLLINETTTMGQTLNKFKETYFNFNINTIRLFFGVVNTIPIIICSWVCVVAIPYSIISLFKEIKSILLTNHQNIKCRKVLKLIKEENWEAIKGLDDYYIGTLE
ncbi:hypothetical protein U3516DRAFT_738678 [Neocallimastix sp. 'constans']